MRGGLTLVALVLGTSAGAQDRWATNAVAVFDDWTVFVEGDPPECFAATTPGRMDPPGTDGRAPVLLVTVRPETEDIGEVSLYSGLETLAFAPSVSITGKGPRVDLIPQDAWAWPIDPDADMQVLAILQETATVTVSGTFADGSPFRDLYSTRGMTAALTEALRRCAG